MNKLLMALLAASTFMLQAETNTNVNDSAKNMADDEQTERGKFIREVNKLWRQGDFAALERISNELRTKKTKLPDGQWKLVDFYFGISVKGNSEEGYLAAEKQLKAWEEKYPQSVTAPIVEGAILIGHGWLYHKAGENKKAITDQGLAKYPMYLTRAADVLEKVKDRCVTCPDWYNMMLFLGIQQEWDKAKFDQIFENGVKVAPDYHSLYINRAIPLFNRLGLWLAFALKQAELHGADIYPRIICSLVKNYPEELFTETLVLWPKMKAGFEKMLRDYPESNWILNNYCRYACLAGDRATAKELFGRIGENRLSQCWTEKEFVKWKLWSRKRLPLPALSAGSLTNKMDPASLGRLLGTAWKKSPEDLRAAVDKGEIGPQDMDANHYYPLMALAFNDDAEHVEKLLDAGVDINATNKDGCTALHYCAEYGCLKTAVCLVQHGADIDRKNKWKETPLTLACANNKRELVSMLLTVNADPNMLAQHGPPLFYANQDANIVKDLLDFGADANGREIKSGDTALIFSAASLQSLRLMLEAGADINATNKAGHSALLVALINNRITTAEALLDAGADWRLKDLEGNSAIVYAANAPSPVLVDRLAKLGANTNEIHVCDMHLSQVTNSARRWPYAITTIQAMDECIRFSPLENKKLNSIEFNKIKSSLASFWGVVTKAKLLEKLNIFESAPMSAEFSEVAKAVAGLSDQQFEKEQEDLLVNDPHLRQQRQIVRKYLAQGGKGDLVGWEAARYINLLQLGRARGFLNEKDCWNRIAPRLKPLQDRFGSWQEFADNVRVGYAFNGDAGSGKYDLITRMLLNNADANSPWNQVGWKEALDIEKLLPPRPEKIKPQ